MAYTPLTLPDSLPGAVGAAIAVGVEPLLKEFHWMLATPIAQPDSQGPHRQFQFSVALVLLATVAGVSKTLLDINGENRDRVLFQECLKRYFPWDIDPPYGVSYERASEILYKVFRNPLVHCLGFQGGGEPVVRIGQVLRGTDDAEKRVEWLERLTTKPGSEPCLVVTSKKTDLWLDPLGCSKAR